MARRNHGQEVLDNPQYLHHAFFCFYHQMYTAEKRSRYREKLTANISQHIEALLSLDSDALQLVRNDNGETGNVTLTRALTYSYFLPSGDVVFLSRVWAQFFRIHEPIF